MKYYSVSWGQLAFGFDGEHAFLQMYSVTVYLDHLMNFENEKTPVLALSLPFWIYEVQTLFSME